MFPTLFTSVIPNSGLCPGYCSPLHTGTVSPTYNSASRLILRAALLVGQDSLWGLLARAQ